MEEAGEEDGREAGGLGHDQVPCWTKERLRGSNFRVIQIDWGSQGLKKGQELFPNQLHSGTEALRRPLGMTWGAKTWWGSVAMYQSVKRRRP